MVNDGTVNSTASTVTVNASSTNIIVPFQEGGKEVETTIGFNDDLEVERDKNTATITLGDKKIQLAVTSTGTANIEVDLGTGVQSTLQIDSTKSKTVVDSQGNVKTTLATGNESSIEMNLNIDGTVNQIVKYRGSITNVVSNIKGAKVVIDAKGKIETTSEVEKNGFIYKAMVSTDTEGKTKTEFVKIEVATGKEVVLSNTLKDNGSFELGSNATISELDGLIYIQVNTALNTTLVIE